MKQTEGYLRFSMAVAAWVCGLDDIDDDVVDALLDWRLRWLRSNPFA